MKYVITILFFLPALLSAQQEINKPERATYFVAYDSLAGIYHVGQTLPNQVTTSGQPDLIAEADEIAFLEATSAVPVNYDPLPEVGEQVDVGIYEYEGELVICRQAHIRTIFEPSETPALFGVYRPDGDQYLEWIANEDVYIGTVRSYEGVLYICIQAHFTLSTWQPPNVPALWDVYVPDGGGEECPDWVQPTGAQDAYQLGACVTHNGQEWINTGSDANVWEPGVFGWELR